MVGDLTPAFWLAVAVLLLLGVATGIGHSLRARADRALNPAMLQTFNLRLRAWWLLMSLVTATFILPKAASVTMFGLISFWALREFITLTPTRIADHRALFWVFFLFTPLQFVLVALDSPGRDTYGLYSILIPVYAFLFIPARVAVAGDFRHFLERTAKIQAGLMVCVYCLSYAPALLNIEAKTQHHNRGLLLFLVLIVLSADIFQYVCDKLVGRRVIAPLVSRTKTWEGALAGALATMLVGASLFWITPYPEPWQAAGVALMIAVTGFAGGMTMSAIKRDRGVQDYGTLIEGHGGILDRLDSVCFAAPVYFHFVRYYLG